MPTPLATLHRSPRFAALRARRSFWVGLALATQLGVFALVACLRVLPHDNGGFLGYDVSLALPGAGHAVALGLTVAWMLWAAARQAKKHLDRPDVTRLRPAAGPLPVYGALSGHELVTMVDEVAADMKVGHIDIVAVEDHLVPNAMTARVPGLGSFVLLHTNLLHLLTAAEVRAVVAHEVAHVRASDSMVALASRLPGVAATAMAGWLLVHVADGLLLPGDLFTFLQRLLFLALAWTGWLGARGLITVFTQRASRIAEVIADLRAAAACGYEAHVNALLRIGERAEALAAFGKGVQGVLSAMGEKGSAPALYALIGQLPRSLVDAEKAAYAAPYAFVKHHLEAMRKGLGLALDDEQIRALARGAAEHYWAKAEEKPAGPAEERLSWREFDADRSEFLDRDELERLVEELRTDGKRLLFRTLSKQASIVDSHPTMRDRILAVHAFFGAPEVSR